MPPVSINQCWYAEVICFLMFKQQEFRNAAKCLPHYFMEPGLNITPFMSRHCKVGGFNAYHPQTGWIQRRNGCVTRHEEK